MEPVVFEGAEGEELIFGLTEGGGAPMLTIHDEGVTVGFQFDTPQQLSQFIRHLAPFADARALS